MARTHARTGGRPYPRKPKWSFGPLAPVEKAVREWCRLRGLDPDAKGVRSDAINSLILAGAKARPMGVEVTVELRRLSLADLDTDQSQRITLAENAVPQTSPSRVAELAVPPAAVEVNGWTLGVEWTGAIARGRISRGRDRHTCGHINGHRTEKGALDCAAKMARRREPQ